MIRRTITRRTVLGGTAATLALGARRVAAQGSNWPDHPVRIVVPYPAGEIGRASCRERV